MKKIAVHTAAVLGAISILTAAAPAKAEEFPSHMTGTWSGLEGTFFVRADAEVIVPDTGALCTARVGRRFFTLEEVRMLTDVFMPESIWHPLSGDDAENNISASANHSFLPGFQKKEGVPGEYLYRYAETNGKTMYAYIENSDGSWFDFAAVWEDGYGDMNGIDTAFYAPKRDTETDLPFPDNEITADEALQMGNQLISDLELEHFCCDRMEPIVFFNPNADHLDIFPNAITDTGFVLSYVRTVNGLPVSQTNFSGNGIEENTPVSGVWMYEQIRIYVTSHGIVHFRWDSPYTEPVILEDSVALIDFPDIQEIFSKMIFVKNDYWRTANNRNGFDTIHHIDVDKVQLTLMRIRSKTVLTEGTIVPVWDFWGTITSNQNSESRYEVILSINAINGTIVDRELGY